MKLIVRGLKGFEWDAANWRKSERKHGVAVAEAEEALLKERAAYEKTEAKQ